MTMDLTARPRVLCLGRGFAVEPDTEVDSVPEFSLVLERVREEAVDLLVVSAPAALPPSAADLLADVDGGLVLLLLQDQLPVQDEEAFSSRFLTLTVSADRIDSLRLSRLAAQAHRIRREARRARRTESALRSLRRWSGETEAALRDLYHDLRTPVAIALGYCANVADGIEGPVLEKQVAALRRARSALETMGTLLEAGPVIPLLGQEAAVLLETESSRDPVRRRCRLELMAAEVVAMLEIEAQNRQIQLELTPTPELPAVWAERPRLAQLLLNLTTNALRHARTRVVVAVSQPAEGTSGRVISLDVRDDGPGFAPEFVSRAFERGVSGEGRTGLGLSIVKEIVAEHGGRVEVRSGPGGGAEVHVELPVDLRSRAAPPIGYFTLPSDQRLAQLAAALGDAGLREFESVSEVDELLRSVAERGGCIVLSEAVARQLAPLPAPPKSGQGGGS